MSPSSSVLGSAKQKNVAKPQREHFAKAQVPLKMRVCEFRVADDATLDVGATIAASHFVPGQLVDVAGHTQGKGFAGGDEALGFRRHARHPRRFDQPPCPWFDRQPSGSWPRVQEQEDGRPHGRPPRTQQNLEIVRVDDERGLIFVKGSVPGAKNAWLTVVDSVKVPRHAEAPYPAGIKVANDTAAPAIDEEVIVQEQQAETPATEGNAPAQDGQEG